MGLHVHIGSQIFVADSFAKALERLAPFVRRCGLPELSIGGGLGVAYVEGESSEGIPAWGERVREAVGPAGIEAAISAEPGRAVVAAGRRHPLHRGHDQGRPRRAHVTWPPTAG